MLTKLPRLFCSIVSISLCLAFSSISCQKSGTNKTSSTISVALPSQPTQVRNTGGTWLVYDLHITAKEVFRIEVFDGSRLVHTQTRFRKRDTMHICSIWIPVPENGWEHTGLEQKIYYQNAGSEQTLTTSFPLQVKKEYPAPMCIDFPVPSGVWLAEGAAGASSYHTNSLFPFSEPFFDPVQKGYLFCNNPQRYAIDYARFHNGLPYRGQGRKPEDWYSYDQPIVAVADGTVLFTEHNIPDNKTVGELDYNINNSNVTGNVVYLGHSDGTISVYCHLRQHSISVKPGELVSRGQELGKLGNSGNSTTPHLHMHLLEPAAGKTIHQYSDGLFFESRPYVFIQFRWLGSLPAGYLDMKPIKRFIPSKNRVVDSMLPAESDVIAF
jgi:murein DD-endopeptidase MepM/ murein hydrolase activator NlpD